MALTFATSQKIFAALCGLVLLATVHVIMVKTVSHQTKAVILRGEFVLGMETILVFMSLMIWRTFLPFLKPFSKPNSSVMGPTSKTNGCTYVETFQDLNFGHNFQAQNRKINHVKERFSFLQLILLSYLILCHMSYLTNIFFISKEPHWFAMLAYICLGSYIQLSTSIVIVRILSFFVSLISHSVPPTRKGSGKKLTVIIAVIYTLIATLFGIYTASQPPAVRQVRIPVKDLPNNLEGLSIVQISDIHLGPTVGFTKLNMIVDIVNKENPDLVLLTGDLVDGRVESLRRAAEPLSRVVSKYGNFFVTGNHEYYTGDVDNWFNYLKSLGFTPLHNSNVKIPVKVSGDEGQLCLAGTDDIQADTVGYIGHGFDIASAVKGCAKDQPIVLMAHQPKAAKMALDSNYRVDLVLSGHTHGGQIFPMIVGAYLLNPFYLGLYKYGQDGSHVYVCEGTQYWGIPMRIGTSTEITHITLAKASL
ncbi:hypothetical protein EGW08_021589 [Elysia chlorotica]|uniref:Calcineurin-like phosphoesterase domain-containing protein n=1 Tax=Elysia chlorotica TaxID=188477 RepID=A0A3S0ZAS9_ELYCH|nr:hypothetical protein EGW08_021589 [Elysia chlorotica]